ncbi:MAG TPA: XdhC family protein [Thermomicrobiaceae bacterium]|nr:XdhC family protein [Thermomicrobiaceae bacterium]
MDCVPPAGGGPAPILTTLSEDIFERAATLKRAGRPFVLATVVWSGRPTSARPGARGIVTADGALFGWVGGSCAQPTVVREALAALADGEARLLRLSPDPLPSEARPGVVVAPMTCHSGGTLEIFLEPFLPPLRLLVVGESPVADALVRLGHVMGYRVVAVRPEATATAPPESDVVLGSLDLAAAAAGGRSAAVVATMGVYDEDAVERALRAGIGYVALVASRRRAESVAALLRDAGVPDDALARLRAPAGLDIAASAPEEIAVSILAEIIACRRDLPVVTSALSKAPATAVDPVCGMTVEVSGARHTQEHGGRRYYFCCPACRRRFVANPAAFLATP